VVRVVVGLALTIGAYFPMVTGSVYAAQTRRSTTVEQGIRVSVDFFRRDALMVAVIAAVIVLVGMTLWLPVVIRKPRTIRSVWFGLGIVLALPIAIPAAHATVDAMAPESASHVVPQASLAPPTSVEPCVLTAGGNRCEGPVFEIPGIRLKDSWPVWADVAFAIGLAVPFALLGWAYFWRVRRRSSVLPRTDEFGASAPS
jgi:hypothetical protein